jgi:hypothetical protein
MEGFAIMALGIIMRRSKAESSAVDNASQKPLQNAR